MGFLTRAVVPRSVRRAAHPVRTAKSAVTPRVVKQARNVLNPIDTTVYSVERSLNTKSRKRGRRSANGGDRVGGRVVVNLSALAAEFEAVYAKHRGEGSPMVPGSAVAVPDPTAAWTVIVTADFEAGFSRETQVRVHEDGVGWTVIDVSV